jgi:cytochrome c oxidase cbb3-type subunit 3
MRRTVWLTLGIGAAALACRAQALPDGPGKATYERACGTCHSSAMVLGRAMSRDQWSAEVADMIAKGAKISDADLSVVVDYLAQSFPPATPAAASARAGGRARGGGGGGLTMGPTDKQVVDPAAEARGRTVYIAECVTCHGAKARGSSDGAPPSSSGPDLVRSITVLHDRYGSTIGPFLAKGHAMQSGKTSASLTQPQVQDLSHFLHAMVDETLRGGPYAQPVNILTGDAHGGETFFNGAGRCASCHSPTGDLAHIAAKYDPVGLQQRFVFPRTVSFGRGGRAGVSKPVIVTVTPAGGAPVTGALVHLDDFNVALRDESGAYVSWKRTPDLKVEKKDPYAAHVELLKVYTDQNIHDVLAYLETMK